MFPKQFHRPPLGLSPRLSPGCHPGCHPGCPRGGPRGIPRGGWEVPQCTAWGTWGYARGCPWGGLGCLLEPLRGNAAMSSRPYRTGSLVNRWSAKQTRSANVIRRAGPAIARIGRSYMVFLPLGWFSRAPRGTPGVPPGYPQDTPWGSPGGSPGVSLGGFPGDTPGDFLRDTPGDTRGVWGGC